MKRMTVKLSIVKASEESLKLALLLTDAQDRQNTSKIVEIILPRNPEDVSR